MAKVKEGDRVKVKTPNFSQADELSSVFAHMQGLTGTVEAIYNANEVAVKVDLDSLNKVAKDVHDEATRRMREKVVERLSEEEKKSLSKEELGFVPHSMLLVRETDLEVI